MNQKLDRPIFLGGCAKSGTTMLGLIFLSHPQTGPKKFSDQQQLPSLHELPHLLHEEVFNVVAHEMEKKQTWDKYFPMDGVDLRIGKELTLLKNPLTPAESVAFVEEITADFVEPRFFSKHPATGFRVHVIRELFPDAKILMVHRDGRDVIASWGRKGNRWKRFGGHESAIRLFAKKWNDTVEHIERFREELGLITFRYEDIVADHETAIADLFQKCELDSNDELLKAIELRDAKSLWRERIPEEYHSLVNELTAGNRAVLGYRD